MENEVKEISDYKRYYLREFEYFDGECYIKLNIVDINFENKTIKLAITNRGKITVTDYDLFQYDDKNYYIRFGIESDEIEINDFEEIND